MKAAVYNDEPMENYNKTPVPLNSTEILLFTAHNLIIFCLYLSVPSQGTELAPASNQMVVKNACGW